MPWMHSASAPAIACRYMPNCREYELLFYGASKLGAMSCR